MHLENPAYMKPPNGLRAAQKAKFAKPVLEDSTLCTHTDEYIVHVQTHQYIFTQFLPYNKLQNNIYLYYNILYVVS